MQGHQIPVAVPFMHAAVMHEIKHEENVTLHATSRDSSPVLAIWATKPL